MAACSSSSTRRPLAILVGVLIAAPILAGCLSPDDVVRGVKTRCAESTPALDSVAAPVPLQKSDVTRAAPSPFQGTVRVALMLPPGGDEESARGARLAVNELRDSGAPVTLTEVTLPADGRTAGLAAFRALVIENRTRPSIVISALDADTTEGFVDEAHERRVALFVTAAAESRLVEDHEGSGYFFRVMPPHEAEGAALAELMWAAGCRSANVIVGDTERDRDVRVAFRDAFEAKGGSVGVVVPFTNATEAVYAAEFVSKRGEHEPRPDAIAVITNPEDSGRIVRHAYVQKVAARSAFLFTEHTMGPGFVERAGVDENGHVLAANLRGTSFMRADTPATGAYFETYRRAYDGGATNLSMRAYDATYAGTLAAACARSPEPHLVAAKIPAILDDAAQDTDVSGADPALAWSTAQQCRVNYVGATHDYDYTTDGEPEKARFFVWTVTTGGAIRDAVSRFEPPARS